MAIDISFKLRLLLTIWTKGCKMNIKRIKAFFVLSLFFVSLFNAPISWADSDDDHWDGEDKALHLTVSFALDTIAYNFLKENTHLTDSEAKKLAFIATLAAGVAKEFIDDRFSWKDIGADVLGASIGAAVSIEF